MNIKVNINTLGGKCIEFIMISDQGVFLHVMADALGSVVVLISAAVIEYSNWEYSDYIDPLLSLVIVVLICVSTWPLFRESVLILLNSTPGHIDTSTLESGLMACVPVIRCPELIKLRHSNDCG